MYKNLLVPVDGTELADKAMRESIALAAQLGASITAFVAEPPLPLPPDGRSAMLVNHDARQHADQRLRHARDVLRRFSGWAAEAGVGFSGHHIETDHVDGAIAEAASTYGCDMIVMATHGRGAFGELLFGSHTKGVMARSKLPLLVLH
jgi:nucleotide-binding universal stress UspA family protein